jgi:transcriptional regulator with XRE-family HTH domain
LGISQSYYSKIENGSVRLSENMLSKCLNILHVSHSDPIRSLKNEMIEIMTNQDLNYVSLSNKMIEMEIRINNMQKDINILFQKL